MQKNQIGIIEMRIIIIKVRSSMDLQHSSFYIAQENFTELKGRSERITQNPVQKVKGVEIHLTKSRRAKCSLDY